MKCKHGKHPAGFTFLGAIGIVAVQVAGGADAGVVDLLNAQRTTLPDDFDSEIDLIVRRPNTGTELRDHVGRIGSEAINHLVNGVCDDAELGTFASGMDKADGRSFWIYDVNGATVGDVNAERDT